MMICIELQTSEVVIELRRIVCRPRRNPLIDPPRIVPVMKVGKIPIRCGLCVGLGRVVWLRIGSTTHCRKVKNVKPKLVVLNAVERAGKVGERL